MRFVTPLLFGLILLAPGTGAATPKLAVMTLHDQTRTLSSRLVDGLTDALRSQLAQSGRFIVIDKSRQAAALRRLVSRQKRESYRACYDSSCQIPLGQALAADSILRTQLTRVGSSYLLIAELVDLAKEAVTTAAQARVRVQPAAGREDRLLGAVSAVVRQLTGQGELKVLGVLGGTGRIHGPPPEELEARRQRAEERRRQRLEERRRRRADALQRSEEARRERERLAAEQLRQQQILAGRRQVERARRLRLVYGWMAIISGAIIGATGAYYLGAKVPEDKDNASQATSPDALQTAADDASKHQTAGIVLVSLGGAAVGAGVLLVVTAPRLTPVRVAGGSVELDRLPSGGPTRGGFALGWGGRF
jgi:TolB-like protein